MQIELQISQAFETVTADMPSGEVVWSGGEVIVDGSVPAPSEDDIQAVRSVIFDEIVDLNSAIERMKYDIEKMSEELAEMQQERKVLRRAIDSGI